MVLGRLVVGLLVVRVESLARMPGREWLLIDGYNVMYRSYYAMPSLTRRHDDLPVNAVLGTCNVLLKQALPYILRGSKVIFAMDSRGGSWRNDLSGDYKATRKKMPSDLRCQVEEIENAAKAFGAIPLRVENQEADDIIATLAKLGVDQELSVDILSNDKDLLQLVQPDVNILNAKNERLDGEYVFQSYGIKPEQMADYLTLVGDASDNIKGVKGIGPKSAQKCLTIFGDLDTIITEGPTSSLLSTGIRNKLKAADPDQLLLAKRLVALDTNVPIPDHLASFIEHDETAMMPEPPWDDILDFADRNTLFAFKQRVLRERALYSSG